MLTKDRLQELYDELLSTYPAGLSSTSTKKFDKTRDYLASELGIKKEEIYITGSGTRAGNLEVRLSQGQQAKQHTTLGVAYLLDELGTNENTSKLTNSAFTTAEKYVGASGKAEYDIILVIVIRGTDLSITGIMYLDGSPIATKILSDLPNLVARPISTTSSTSLGTLCQGSSFVQKIYFGAPGAGKSFKVNERISGSYAIRTTFHPDCDYSSFVGSYKPVVQDPSNGSQEGGHITYRYIKQAFLKSYLKAWRLFSSPMTTNASVASFEVKGASYTITAINSGQITQTKDIDMTKKQVFNVWVDLWKDGVFTIPKGRQSGRSIEQAISAYIVTNYLSDGATVDVFEDGWACLLEKLKEGQIKAKASLSGKEYTLSEANEKDRIHVRIVANNTKKRIEECYKDIEECNGVEKGIVDILYGFNSETFDEAWEALSAKVNTNPQSEASAGINTAVPVYLVIEEINRGNCAQIFGDIFQLLDRQDNGFSVYPIEADSEIQKAIARAFEEEEEFKLLQKLDVDYAVENYISVFGSSLSEDVEKGRVLLLPPNLSILATMNTSDQSLFPMDSAFKRRWEWEYVPIDSTNRRSQFKITIGDKMYQWGSFLDKANERIHKLSDSEDKQMGNFFIKSDIDVDEFKCKVMFYLWSEVCKEYEHSGSFFKNKRNNEAEFTFNSLFPTNDVTNEILQGFMEYLGIEEA